MRTLAFLVAVASSLKAAAFDNSRYDNVALYWGQNSYGAAHTDVANFQKPLGYYCQDNAVDVFPIAFLTVFFGPGGLPSINLANTCNPTDNATYPGSTLPNCSALASDIASCQAKGKLVTLSMGGQSGAVGFQSDSQAQAFAQQIWNLFLGGSSSTRPFGNAILDGVDLDIEGGTSAGYAAFVNTLQSLASGSGRKYYITAAPQCVFPDAALGGVLNTAHFDAIYVQFYNNPCGLQAFNQAANWDYGVWDYWARFTSPNPNVKVYIGAPASSSASGSGYVDIGTLSNIAKQMRNSFPSFGGVMLWDASQAYANGRYDLAIKQALQAAGGTGFTYPACSAPAFASGNSYTAGSQISYNGYIWQAKWYASSQPTADPNGEWSPISACGGPSVPPSTSTTSTLTTSTTSSTSTSSTSSSSATSSTSTSSTSTSPTSSPTPGSCNGVAAWSSSVAYTGGQQVIYNGHLWTAKWWTQADTPGGAAGVWTDNGPCTGSNSAAEHNKTPRNLSPNSIFSRFFRYL